MRPSAHYRPTPGVGKSQVPTRSTRFPSERAPDNARGMSGAGLLQVEAGAHPARRREVKEAQRDGRRDDALSRYREMQERAKRSH